MTWNTHYLKFATADEAHDALVAAFGDDGEGNILTNSETHAVDVVGVLWRDDTPEGQEPVAREGYHVNVRVKGDLLDDLTPYIVIPENPARMFA